jgi:phosphoribosylanthranilate isomerase
LFADAPAAEVIEIARRLNIRHVQLHGHEPPQVVAELGAALTVLKAVRVTRDSLTQVLEMWRAAIRDLHLRNLAGLLMETATTKGMGGTGVENDWDAIAAAQRAGAFGGLPPLIAAGGLSPANVGQVVRLLRPWAVDVSSGVEESRGVKSVDRMHAFAAAVRASDQSFSP